MRRNRWKLTEADKRYRRKTVIILLLVLLAFMLVGHIEQHSEVTNVSQTR